MSKKQIFWLIVALSAVALIVFVKVAPAWVTLVCVVIAVWKGRPLYEKYINGKKE
jgi:hypothetical protein|nr:MAG TPA: hypothetical protein [Caudoviricetes sp.]